MSYAGLPGWPVKVRTGDGNLRPVAWPSLSPEICVDEVPIQEYYLECLHHREVVR